VRVHIKPTDVRHFNTVTFLLSNKICSKLDLNSEDGIVRVKNSDSIHIFINITTDHVIYPLKLCVKLYVPPALNITNIFFWICETLCFLRGTD
jgi:hypothetical protein